MRKVGRNDPCPCGSGKPYGSCCLPIDEAHKVTRLVRDDERAVWSPADAARIAALIEEKLEWPRPSHREIARRMAFRLGREYGPDDVAYAVMLWHMNCLVRQPDVRKEEVVFAAVEYVLAKYAAGRTGVTLAAMADKYRVSAAAVSRKAAELNDIRVALREIVDEDLLRERGGLPRGSGRDGTRRPKEPAARRESGGPADPRAARDRAHRLLLEAWDTPDVAERLQLVGEAMKLYPHCPDIFNILAELARTDREIREFYEMGMEAGETDLGPLFFERHRGRFWGLSETRPYMRSKFGYAQCCERMGDLAEAARHYEELLELDPMDNQGVRHSLVGVYCRLKRFDKADRLLDDYPEDSAFGTYDRVLVEFGLHGLSDRLEALVEEARRCNPHVLPYLTGRKQMPKTVPDAYAPGQISEAVVYAGARLRVWERQRPLIEWLKAEGWDR